MKKMKINQETACEQHLKIDRSPLIHYRGYPKFKQQHVNVTCIKVLASVIIADLDCFVCFFSVHQQISTNACHNN